MESNDVKISVIVPVYNQEKHLEKSIKSLQMQTIKELEYVFVDDASEDESAKIISSSASIDDRIVLIKLEKNSGTSYARKCGVLAASGKYVMFLDSDDFLEEDACQIIWDEMQSDPVDILQFGTRVNYVKKVEKSERDELDKILRPNQESYNGELVKQCFGNHKWGYTLWNKAYNAAVCKKAFADISDEYILVSEDVYAFFIISHYSNSYRGITRKLYNYNYGCGITNNSYIDFERFQKHCTRMKVPTALERFSIKIHKEDQYQKLTNQIKKDFIQEVLYCWRYFLAIEDARKGYDLLVDIMGVKEVVSVLAEKYWHDCPKLLERISKRYVKREKGKSVKRIGIYYHRIRNGGVERVISLLIPMWLKNGYEIVLITDEEPHKDDYDIPSCVEREVVYNFVDSEAGKYKERAEAWENIIERHQLDTIIYSSCNCFTIMWDVCLMKGLDCNVIVETHSMFSGTMWYSPIFASFLPLIYRLIDRVVALSTIDVLFWKNFCPAYYIPNPLTSSVNDELAKLDTKNVLWVGRLSPEKRPEAILDAFEIVHRSIPEATLTVVGEGDSEDEMNKLIDRAYKLGIQDVVEFAGFQRDVEQYYRKASVFAITSLCESFSMVLAESKSYGVPTVMYELPNLEMTRDSAGIIAVPQEDVFSLAFGIITVLNDKELRKDMGRQAHESIKKVSDIDIAEKWREVFDSFNYEIKSEDYMDKEQSLMMELLFHDFLRGTEFLIANNAFDETNDPGISHVVRRIKIHEEILERHEEVVNRHEEVVNRHEEVVNRHEMVVNDDWAWLKGLEERVSRLERERSIFRKILSRLKRIFIRRN